MHPLTPYSVQQESLPQKELQIEISLISMHKYYMIVHKQIDKLRIEVYMKMELCMPIQLILIQIDRPFQSGRQQ